MTGNPAADLEQARRQQRREFIRTHHPDAGGDHDDFVAGLADLDARLDPRPSIHPTQTNPTRVTVVAQQVWPVSLTTSVLRRWRRRRTPRVR